MSLHDAVMSITALGETTTPNRTSHFRAVAHAVRELDIRLAAMEAALAVIAKRAGVSADDVSRDPRFANLTSELHRILG